MSQQGAGEAGAQAERALHRAAGQADQQLTRLSDVIKEQPLASVLVAVGIGYLLGRIIH